MAAPQFVRFPRSMVLGRGDTVQVHAASGASELGARWVKPFDDDLLLLAVGCRSRAMRRTIGGVVDAVVTGAGLLAELQAGASIVRVGDPEPAVRAGWRRAIDAARRDRLVP